MSPWSDLGFKCVESDLDPDPKVMDPDPTKIYRVKKYMDLDP